MEHRVVQRSRRRRKKKQTRGNMHMRAHIMRKVHGNNAGRGLVLQEEWQDGI
jgi:hypothetical protein